MVVSSSEALPGTAAPQDEQNRPASGSCEPHDTQIDINLSA
jgi:hypothetical protein